MQQFKRIKIESPVSVMLGLQTAYVEILKGSVITSSTPETAVEVTIGTHDGSFHCDEALAIAMLKFLPRYEAATVVRSRNPSLLDPCTIVVDVGAVYNPDTLRFDHHQREFNHTLEGYETKLSSAGLVYKHFGKDIIRRILANCEGHTYDDSTVETFYQKIYKGFIEHVDAIDNGIPVADGPLRYQVSSTLSSRVGHLNPAWNEPQGTDVCNKKFISAMILTGTEFLERVLSLATSWWPARHIVKQAVEKRRSIHTSGQIAVLEQFCPWKEHLFELEIELCGGCAPILYMIYADSGGSWRIQAVPVDPASFDSRKKLPEAWRGIRDDNLSELVGAPGAIFVHASGFIGGHKTLDGALAMAIKALEMN